METNNNGTSVLNLLKITGAFWALVLFGPGLVMILNNVTIWFSGAGFYEGSFGYEALVFFSQTIACALACNAAEGISSDHHQVCVLVNEIIAVCLFVIMALYMFFLLGETLKGINYVLSATVTIVYSVKTAKTLTKI